MLVFKLMLLPEPLKSLLAATFWELTTYFIPWSDLADRFLQEVRDEDLLLYWQDLITITVRLPMSKLSGAVCHRGPNPHCYVRDCSGHAQLWRQFVHCIPCSYLHNGSEEISEVTHNQTNAASLLLSQMEKDFHYKKLVGGGEALSEIRELDFSFSNIWKVLKVKWLLIWWAQNWEPSSPCNTQALELLLTK